MMRGRESDHQVVTQQNVTAVVKWFNPIKGFGFVQLGDGMADAFMHVSVLQDSGFQTLPEGATIVCDIAEGRRGPQVAAIVRVEEVPEGPVQTGAPETNTVEGVVKFYNSGKGYGFIVPDDGTRDVFISAKTLERSGVVDLQSNQRVRVFVRIGHKGPMAEGLEPI